MTSTSIFSGLLTVEEMMKKLGVSKETLYRYMRKGMPSLWLAGRKFNPDEVAKWADEHREYGRIFTAFPTEEKAATN